jgi:hypothetical protein
MIPGRLFWLAAALIIFFRPCEAQEVLAVGAIDALSGARLDEIIAKTAGGVTDDAIAKFGSDFESYWQAGAKGREGKVFEAVIADTMNRRAAATGMQQRLVPTAMLGQVHNAADLLLVDDQGRVLDRFQAKLGFTNLRKAIDEPKYSGMKLITSQESYDQLSREAVKRSQRAVAKGIFLSPEWERVVDALGDGRILSKLPCGAPLPERTFIEQVAKDHYRQVFASRVAARPVVDVADDAAKAVSRAATETGEAAASTSDDLVTAAARNADDMLRPASKLLGRAAGVAGVAWEVGNKGWKSYKVEQRYAAGDMTSYQREVEHAANAGAALGGLGGGAGGFVLGAEAGTLACPGVGTLAGGLVGAVGGAIAGEQVMRDASAKAIVLLHDSGRTFAGLASDGWETTSQAATDIVDATNPALVAMQEAGTGVGVVAAEWAETAQLATASTIAYVEDEGGPLLDTASQLMSKTATEAWESISNALGW